MAEAGKFRNTYRGRRVYVKPHNLIRDNCMLSITPHRGIYAENNDTITLSKPGYLTFDFFGFVQNGDKKVPDYKNKFTFVMTLRNIGDFLKINDNYTEGEDPIIMNYSNNWGEPDSKKVNVLKVAKKLIEDDDTTML